MGTRILQCCMLFILCHFVVSEAMWQNKVLDNQENKLLSSSEFGTQLDTIPIINPTTPSTTTPIINPPSPTTATPTYNPTRPPPATPTYNPMPPATTTPTYNPMPPTTTTPTPSGPTSSGGSWCIASQSASETALQVALDYACGYGGTDCSAIQQGASCYNPNTLRDHASYAFNSYYQKNPVPTSCAFGGAAQLTNKDPSSGSCRFATPRTAQSTSPPANPSPINPSPVTPTPPAPSTPTGSGSMPSPTIFDGSEPTATPNSGVPLSLDLMLFFTATSLLSIATNLF
ncbi:hypothetical protein DCAR_0208941 [Daucus carota subsp. sativus]|uniref:X8 domain-containing protein n=1 Tax=Daucus carota subsp. sativus TaxID=79200 RepID=A0AAF0WJV9_DAUCS|nr:hypothetical protein DCAR_0208941 [Daucus carota subsp. sativus]